MTTRPARPEDAPILAEIEQEAAFNPWSRQAIEQAIRAPSTRGWVAQPAQRVVGLLLASTAADEGELLTLSIRPGHRRQGLARALLACCFSWWTTREVTQAFLEVRRTNRAALALYTSTGWREIGVRAAYYHDGVDALQLAWRPRC